jgi:PAS domain S-box-containing protein
LTERRRFADVNPAMQRLLGYTRDELVGRPVAELLPASVQPVLESEWQRFLQTACSPASATWCAATGWS